MYVVGLPSISSMSVLSLESYVSAPFSYGSRVVFDGSLGRHPEQSGLCAADVSPFQECLVTSTDSGQTFVPLLYSLCAGAFARLFLNRVLYFADFAGYFTRVVNVGVFFRLRFRRIALFDAYLTPGFVGRFEG